MVHYRLGVYSSGFLEFSAQLKFLIYLKHFKTPLLKACNHDLWAVVIPLALRFILLDPSWFALSVLSHRLLNRPHRPSSWCALVRSWLVSWWTSRGIDLRTQSLVSRLHGQRFPFFNQTSHPKRSKIEWALHHHRFGEGTLCAKLAFGRMLLGLIVLGKRVGHSAAMKQNAFSCHSMTPSDRSSSNSPIHFVSVAAAV